MNIFWRGVFNIGGIALLIGFFINWWLAAGLMAIGVWVSLIEYYKEKYPCQQY